MESLNLQLRNDSHVVTVSPSSQFLKIFVTFNNDQLMFRIDANSLSPFKSVKRLVPKLSNDKISVTLLYHRCHVRDSVTSNYNGNASPHPIRVGVGEIDQSESARIYTPTH